MKIQKEIKAISCTFTGICNICENFDQILHFLMKLSLFFLFIRRKVDENIQNSTNHCLFLSNAVRMPDDLWKVKDILSFTWIYKSTPRMSLQIVHHSVLWKFHSIVDLESHSPCSHITDLHNQVYICLLTLMELQIFRRQTYR